MCDQPQHADKMSRRLFGLILSISLAGSATPAPAADMVVLDPAAHRDQASPASGKAAAFKVQVEADEIRLRAPRVRSGRITVRACSGVAAVLRWCAWATGCL